PALLDVADRVVRLEAAAVGAPRPAPEAGVSGSGQPTPTQSPQGTEPEDTFPADAEGLVTMSRAQGGVLTRVRAMAAPRRGPLALALLLGSLALGSAVGLMATSGWLISRASQQPPVFYLMVAVTATRTFGIGRAVFRYAERLVSHDAVLR